MISTSKLIKMARKWQRLATASRKRLALHRSSSSDKPPVAEKGHFVMHTADEKRFELPLAFLESEIFGELLRMAEEEFGLASSGPITLACDTIFVEYAISMVHQCVPTELVAAVILSLSDGQSSLSSSSSSSMHLCPEQFTYKLLLT